jgi:hypothetical protein
MRKIIQGHKGPGEEKKGGGLKTQIFDGFSSFLRSCGSHEKDTVIKKKTLFFWGTGPTPEHLEPGERT